jgi:hypothetical protein
MIGDPNLTWTCHVCGATRPDAAISVRSRVIELGKPRFEVTENVRYCNDNPDCIEKSKTLRLVQEGDREG